MQEDAAQKMRPKDYAKQELCHRTLGKNHDKQRKARLSRKNLESTFPDAMGVTGAQDGWPKDYIQVKSDLPQSSSAYQRVRKFKPELSDVRKRRNEQRSRIFVVVGLASIRRSPCLHSFPISGRVACSP